MVPGFLVWVGFALLALLGYLFADKDNMLTVAQMQSHGAGFQKGIPLLGHWAAAYLDFLLPILLAMLVVKYGQWWSSWQIVIVFVISLLLSGAMHWSYIQGGMKFPEAQTHGGTLTTAGVVHLYYMALAFTVIGLFFLCTPNPLRFDVYLAAVWLWVHVVIGVHVPLKLLKPDWFPYPNIVDAGTLGPIIGVAAILSGMSWWALG